MSSPKEPVRISLTEEQKAQKSAARPARTPRPWSSRWKSSRIGSRRR